MRQHKYNLKKQDLKSIYAMADMTLEGHYHDAFKKLGLRQGQGGNFHCPNADSHGKGEDKHPSVSIDNATGRWHCFTCGTKGNFNTFFKEYLAGNGGYGDSYTDFIIDFLNISAHVYCPTEIEDDYEEKAKALREQVEHMKASYRAAHNKDYVATKESDATAEAEVAYPLEDLKKWNQALLENKGAMDYLFDKRHVDDKVVKTYMLGFLVDQYGKDRIVFPQFDSQGNCINVKLYNPFETVYKWAYLKKGNKTGPSPINNFMGPKLYFFEGEPDCYCALGYGLNGVTMGPCSVTDVVSVFGPETAKMLFTGKECVIVFDADGPGRAGAAKLAKNLYPYARQIKIIDLDVSAINPHGLPPDEIEKDGKMKRIYKDFTDFMVTVNGNGEEAFKIFNELEKETPVYIENDDRVRKIVTKVTLQESRHPRYHCNDGSQELELVGAVSEFDSRSLLFPKRLRVSCPAMKDPNECGKICNYCRIGKKSTELGKVESIIYYLDREIDPRDKRDPHHIQITPHNILGLVEVTEAQRDQQIRKLTGIPRHCSEVMIEELEKEKLIHVRLVKDLDEQHQVGDASTSEIDVEAYMLEKDICANRSYLFRGVQTTAWDGQHAVLFLHSATPIMTSVESFKVTDEIKSVLKAISPRDGETIEGLQEYFDERYRVFGNAAGLSGRQDLFFISDLVFFSQTEIHNKNILPEVPRGWGEAGIFGDTRCGKTIATLFLHKHYGVGEFLAGSNAVSRSGLMGGVSSSPLRKSSIIWGKIPMNDGNTIIIDELSNIATETLKDMTSCRSNGVVNISMIQKGNAAARTRKIMISNDPDPSAELSGGRTSDGMTLSLRVCRGIPAILSRFDIVIVVKQDDVAHEDFQHIYEAIQTKFTEFQERCHIRWVMSRTPKDIVYEEGLEQCIHEAQGRLLEKYHPLTHLINQEMRAKLLRMATSVAGIACSTDDYNRLIVKKVHVLYMEKYYDKLYSSKNMRLDIYSKIQRQNETLGDMRFMENILKYISLYAVMGMDDINDIGIYHIFHDYVQRVVENKLMIVDAMDDDIKSCGGGLRQMDVLNKLVGVMLARNCIVRKGGKYRKTSMFDHWLNKRLEAGKNAQSSNILECSQTQRDLQTLKICQNLDKVDRESEARKAG